MDDEGQIRDIAGQFFHRIGYTVEFARDGAEAIEPFTKIVSSRCVDETTVHEYESTALRGSL